MGREQKRKLEKKYGKKNEKLTDDKSLKKYLHVLLVIIIIVLAFYLITAGFITKELDLSGKVKNSSSTSSNEEETQNVILAKNTFRQIEEVYYVYYYDFTSENTNIENAISTLEENVYRVNTSDAMNTNFVSETGNADAKTLDELKVSSPTLIKIESDVITSYNSGEDNILLYLG